MLFLEWMLTTMRGFNPWSVAARLVIAALLGGFIGSERGKHGRAAGLRTHVLVCVGSAVTVLVGLYAAQTLNFASDPMRIGAQVISGVGFLGAGTILHHNQTQVTGLTTAAGLWTTASIGLALGAGAYWIALLAFIIMMITVVLLNRLERFGKKDVSHSYYVEIDHIAHVNGFAEEIEDIAQSIQLLPARSGLAPQVGILLTVTNTCEGTATIRRLRALPHVLAVLSTPA